MSKMESSNVAHTATTRCESQPPKRDKTDDSSPNFCRMSKEKRVIMITLWVASFSAKTFYALMGPFFAQEVSCALKYCNHMYFKGVSCTVNIL